MFESKKLVVLSDEYEEILLNIEQLFDNSHNTIHRARNEIKLISYKDSTLVVKSFKKPNIINRIIYTFFKSSKAKKSYENSIRIAKFAPNPIGYIEFYNFGLLSNSYFISEKFTYDFTIREPLLDYTFDRKEDVFKAFAKFTFNLHENGILHKDYSPGNILIKKDNDNYIFKIVDINRMEFKELKLEERLKNFAKLWAKDDDLKIIISEYAKIINEDKTKCWGIALKYSQSHKDRINAKKRRRGQKVVD